MLRSEFFGNSIHLGTWASPFCAKVEHAQSLEILAEQLLEVFRAVHGDVVGHL